MEKKPFVTREQLEEIKKTYPTPFHLYDEKGIRENGERLMRAFSWNKGFREYFARYCAAVRSLALWTAARPTSWKWAL